MGGLGLVLEDKRNGWLRQRSLRAVLDLCLDYRLFNGPEIDHHSIVGLQKSASRKEIEEAYESMATVWKASVGVAPAVMKALGLARKAMLNELPVDEKLHPLRTCVNADDEQ
ncbi:hypothetical protein Slin15195_G059970 [Septoria linicola]|uniref:J domain-containing protein n=1 Tax=Septoria linicola TaxID=215465 RepID=A0A9Q9AV45_9PEZI|nr:hypothetical protein Slin14017_G075820 [Septoria linicola]USW52678.1 hypothetical protein Slin15195_G059970 [Septoria linicola]